MYESKHFDAFDSNLIRSDELDWIDNGTGNLFKVLRVSKETGYINLLIKSPPGQVNPAHTHLGPSDFYIISGGIDYRGGSARAGDWIYEPAGAIHEATSHSEETIYLANVYGPVAFHDGKGGYSHIFDWRSALEMLNSAKGE